MGGGGARTRNDKAKGKVPKKNEVVKRGQAVKKPTVTVVALGEAAEESLSTARSKAKKPNATDEPSVTAGALEEAADEQNKGIQAYDGVVDQQQQPVVLDNHVHPDEDAPVLNEEVVDETTSCLSSSRSSVGAKPRLPNWDKGDEKFALETTLVLEEIAKDGNKGIIVEGRDVAKRSTGRKARVACFESISKSLSEKYSWWRRDGRQCECRWESLKQKYKAYTDGLGNGHGQTGRQTGKLVCHAGVQKYNCTKCLKGLEPSPIEQHEAGNTTGRSISSAQRGESGKGGRR